MDSAPHIEASQPAANGTGPLQAFTAGQIARASGKYPQVIRRWLKRVRADGERIVRGNLTAVWRFGSLPPKLQNQITEKLGSQSIEDFLGKRDAWQPEIPWNKVCSEQQVQALKLQRALLPVIERRKHSLLNAAELQAIGVRQYQAEFGRTISPERWQYLFNRTLDRDRGLEQFQRVELFLPGNLKRAALLVTPPADRSFALLHDLILHFTDPKAPSAAEKSLLWKRTFECLRPSVGRELKQKRQRLLKFLWNCAPWLAASPNALRVALDRALAKGYASDGEVEAFVNGREERRGKPTSVPYDREQVELIKLAAAKYTGCRRVEAARELNERGLITDPRIKHALDTATSKSHLPASLRAEMKDLAAWQVVCLGPRATRKMVPSMKLAYDGIFSMTCLVGDDHTPDLYVAVPDGNDWFNVMRPQLLLINDFRSSRILSRAVVPHPQYTALDVLSAYKRALRRYGLPKFILREGGLWRKSKLVNSLSNLGTGRASNAVRRNNGVTAFSLPEIEFGLERKRVNFCDTLDQFSSRAGYTIEQLAEQLGQTPIEFRESYQARSKPVEGIIYLFSKIAQRLPCYCGNDERHNCPENTKRAVSLVRARKARPEDVEMLVWDQWVKTVDSIIEKYNSTRQEGRRLRNPLTGEPMSPDEAFEIFTNAGDPPMAFDAHCDVLLARPPVEVEVKKPNIRRSDFPCGFVELRGNTYCDEQTGARIGQKLLAFFDPEMPEVCTFTKLNMRDPFTVPRLESTNALFPDEQMGISRAQAYRTIAAVKASYQATEAKFDPVVRAALVAPHVRALNEHVKTETRAIQEEEQQKAERTAKAAKRARNLGLHPRQARPGDPVFEEGLEMMARAERKLDAASAKSGGSI